MDDDYDEGHEAVKSAFRSITGMRYVYVDILKLNLTSMPTFINVNTYIYIYPPPCLCGTKLEC